MRRPAPASLLAVALVSLVAAPALRAQPPGLERRIADFRMDLPFVESARAFVVDAARRADSATVRRTIALLDSMRAGETIAWLSPFERLAVLAALPASDVLEDSAAIAGLLDAERTTAPGSAFPDDHVEELRELIRTGALRIAGRYDELRPTEESRRFLNLLLNHLHLVGLRGRGDLASRAEAFVATYGGTWRAAIVRRDIIGAYRESRFGLAFAAGYRSGGVAGPAAGAIDLAYGAALAGEAYLGELSIALELLVGIAHAPAPFEAGGASWPAGELGMLGGSILAGYEFRLDRWALTPLAGLAMHSLRAELADGREPLRTGGRLGLEAGAMLGYRIAFDAGTHIDLRLRGGASFLSMAGYDERLDGTLFYVQAGFALVYRPYSSRGG